MEKDEFFVIDLDGDEFVYVQFCVLVNFVGVVSIWNFNFIVLRIQYVYVVFFYNVFDGVDLQFDVLGVIVNCIILGRGC